MSQPDRIFIFPKWFWLVLGCGLALIAVMTFLPIATRPREASAKTSSLSNMKQLGTSLMIYAVDYDDHMPRANDWSTSSYYYRKNNTILDDPTRGRGLKFGYAFFEPLGGVDIAPILNPADIPLVIQSEVIAFDAYGNLSILPTRPRLDGTKDIYAHLDTSAKIRPRAWASLPVLLKTAPASSPTSTAKPAPAKP